MNAGAPCTSKYFRRAVLQSAWAEQPSVQDFMERSTGRADCPPRASWFVLRKPFTQAPRQWRSRHSDTTPNVYVWLIQDELLSESGVSNRLRPCPMMHRTAVNALFTATCAWNPGCCAGPLPAPDDAHVHNKLHRTASSL